MDGAIAGVLAVLLFLLGLVTGLAIMRHVYGRVVRQREAEMERMIRKLERTTAETEQVYQAKAVLN